MKINISDQAFEYLLIQRGEVYDAFSNGGRAAWEEAYETSLVNIMHSIAPALPAPNVRLRALDIGSGLGGINIFLNTYYNGKIEVNLLDGIDNPPRVDNHNRPFNNMNVARDFLLDNGINVMHPWSNLAFPGGQFDLIMSYAAWCFHIDPRVYLHNVRRACHSETRLIVDVRKDKNWDRQLGECFKFRQLLAVGEKFKRAAYWGIK